MVRHPHHVAHPDRDDLAAFGISLLVIQGIRGRGKLSDVELSSAPFMIALLIMIAIRCIWLDVVMWAPHMLDETDEPAAAAEIGAPVDDIDTPALVVDLDAFDRNIAKMAEFARATGVRVRPHAKTTVGAIALRQIAEGAVGQCVQKVGEAEALVRGGVTDVLVSCGSSAIVSCADLPRSPRGSATIALCFDSPEQVDAAFQVARTSMSARRPRRDRGRHGALRRCAGKGCGRTRPPYRRRAESQIPQAASLSRPRAAYGDIPAARQGDRIRGRFRPRDARRPEGRRSHLRDRRRRRNRHFAFEAESGVYNELQVGSYVFMDTEYARIGDKDGGLYAFEHSLFVLATVISVPADDRAIVDAGLKSTAARKVRPGSTASRMSRSPISPMSMAS